MNSLAPLELPGFRSFPDVLTLGLILFVFLSFLYHVIPYVSFGFLNLPHFTFAAGPFSFWRGASWPPGLQLDDCENGLSRFLFPSASLSADYALLITIPFSSWLAGYLCDGAGVVSTPIGF